MAKRSEVHQKKNSKKACYGILNLGRSVKNRLCDAAVHAVGMGQLPLKISDKKPGIFVFDRSLVEAGETVPVGKSVDIEHIIPSRRGVTLDVKQQA